jgi:hypothetical protein
MPTDLRQRRVISRIVRFGLIALAVVLVAMWVQRRTPDRERLPRMQADAPIVEALGAGDLQIFNVDSTVDVMLKGDRILAGLSPKTVAKVREEIARSTSKDTTGLGASIAQMVKQQVADKIATRVVYDVRDIRDIRYENEKLVIEWKRGGEQELFGSVKVDRDREAGRFRPEDARAFIDAVNARRRELP